MTLFVAIVLSTARPLQSWADSPTRRPPSSYDYTRKVLACHGATHDA